MFNLEWNWNYIDVFVVGYNDELMEYLRFWCVRFVLIFIMGRYVLLFWV